MRRFTAIILLVTAGAIILPAQAFSKWVRLGDGPRLHYVMDTRGGVRLPMVLAAHCAARVRRQHRENSGGHRPVSSLRIGGSGIVLRGSGSADLGTIVRITVAREARLRPRWRTSVTEYSNGTRQD